MLSKITKKEKRKIEKFIGIGKDINSQASKFRKSEIECHFFDTTEELLASHILREMCNECILIKGSRTFHFEDVSEALEKKVHQTILEVNLNALRDNLNRYRNNLNPETKSVCMVKASAYGAGALEVGRTAQGRHYNGHHSDEPRTKLIQHTVRQQA